MNKFLNEHLFKLINTEDCHKVLLFGIGSYPSNIHSNHDNPKIYYELKKNKELKVYRILIDPEYKNGDTNRFDENTFLYKNKINYREYYMIIDFCNMMCHFKCLSIIMEFTNITRKLIENNNVVYICPNNCMANTDIPIYNPIIEYNIENNNYKFYRLTDENLYIELKKLMTSPMSKIILQKIKYINYTIVSNFLKINNIYLPILNFMKVKESFLMNFNKNSDTFERSLDQIKYRMNGYYKNDTEELINSFHISTDNNLENYINNKVNGCLLNCSLLERNERNESNENNINKITYSNDNELRTIVEHYNSVFKNIIDELKL